VAIKEGPGKGLLVGGLLVVLVVVGIVIAYSMGLIGK
jgi:hypothetical protein